MRKKFNRVVENGRNLTGDYGSGHGDRYGLFHVMHFNTQTLLRIIACAEGEGWDHVSVSTQHRCPTWPEMCYVKDLFFEPEECVVQFHPPASDYVNVHPFCLHLWRPTGKHIELPPQIFV